MFTDILTKLEDQLTSVPKSTPDLVPADVLARARTSEEDIEKLKSKYEV